MVLNLPHLINPDTPGDATEVQENFQAIVDFINSNLFDKSGGTVTGQITRTTSAQTDIAMLFNGQEAYQAGNTSTDGVAVKLGFNRSNNRQLNILDSARKTVNTTNPMIKIGVTDKAYIASYATDGTTQLPMQFDASQFNFNNNIVTDNNKGIYGKNTLGNPFRLIELSSNNYIYIGHGNPIYHQGSIYFTQDNTNDVGSAALRARVFYAGTGTINTSDANEKTEPKLLTEIEKLVAKEIKEEGIFTFQFNDAVALKGVDGARIHIGTTAQKVQEIFIKHGLNPDRYAMFCSDTWYEYEGQKVEVDENKQYTTIHYELNGEIIVPDFKDIFPEDLERVETKHDTVEKTRLGIRYDQLWGFIISAL